MSNMSFIFDLTREASVAPSPANFRSDPLPSNRLDNTCFDGLEETATLNTRVLLFYIDLLTFSMGIMSAAVSKVQAIAWYVELVVMFQELVAMVYWCAILGYGLDHILDIQEQPSNGQEYPKVGLGEDLLRSVVRVRSALGPVIFTPGVFWIRDLPVQF